MFRENGRRAFHIDLNTTPVDNNPHTYLAMARSIALSANISDLRVRETEAGLAPFIFTSIEDARRYGQEAGYYNFREAGRYMFQHGHPEEADNMFMSAIGRLISISDYPGDENWQIAFSLARSCGFVGTEEELYRQILLGQVCNDDKVKLIANIELNMNPRRAAAKMVDSGVPTLAVADYLHGSHFYGEAYKYYQRCLASLSVCVATPEQAVNVVVRTAQCVNGIGSCYPVIDFYGT